MESSTKRERGSLEDRQRWKNWRCNMVWLRLSPATRVSRLVLLLLEDRYPSLSGMAVFTSVQSGSVSLGANKTRQERASHTPKCQGFGICSEGCTHSLLPNTTSSSFQRNEKFGKNYQNHQMTQTLGTRSNRTFLPRCYDQSLLSIMLKFPLGSTVSSVQMPPPLHAGCYETCSLWSALRYKRCCMLFSSDKHCTVSIQAPLCYAQPRSLSWQWH